MVYNLDLRCLGAAKDHINIGILLSDSTAQGNKPWLMGSLCLCGFLGSQRQELQSKFRRVRKTRGEDPRQAGVARDPRSEVVGRHARPTTQVST